MGRGVTWFEIYTGEPSRLFGFYEEVFGWKVEPMGGEDYGIVDTGSGGIGGGIGRADGPNETLFSIEVDDPQAFLDRVEAAGGKTLMPVTETPGAVASTRFADPQGNVVGLFRWLS